MAALVAVDEKNENSVIVSLQEMSATIKAIKGAMNKTHGKKENLMGKTKYLFSPYSTRNGICLGYPT